MPDIVKIGVSEHRAENATFSLCSVDGRRRLRIQGPGKAGRGFSGEFGAGGDFFCPLDPGNAVRLRQVLPFTAPSPLGGQDVSFGVGDRLGLAGPGHLRALSRYRAAPVLAQQSVRELELMERDYPAVIDAATWAVLQEGYKGPWGADGDHLKTEEYVRAALRSGFTMITADVSEHIHQEYLDLPAGELREAYVALPPHYRERIEKEYLKETLALDTGREVSFNEEVLARTALVYCEAVEHAQRLYSSGQKVKSDFDFELSMDETVTPTSPEAHAFVALEGQKAGIRVSSLAPRFLGEFQKGIDYIGDPLAFERSLSVHAALARALGHRLSVHSGSDKFSVFPAVGRQTRMRFHIKTSGTSWLEALRVLAAREPALYRELHARALRGCAAARAYYHVTPDLEAIPDIRNLSDQQLPELLEKKDSRQLVHITYGEILRDSTFKAQFFASVERHLDSYWAALENHIGRHLELLAVPLV
jgi:hypothetical protein